MEGKSYFSSRSRGSRFGCCQLGKETPAHNDELMPRQTIRSRHMKTQCLLRRNQYHTTAWMDAEATKLGLIVEIPQLGGLWEIVEIFPYRLTNRQLKRHHTLILY
jgi:hypothetical protein